MERATRPWLLQHSIPTEKWTAFLRKLSKYTIYGNMLLLPANTFECPEYQAIEPYLHDNSLQDLYTIICRCLKTTVIAINKPIPPQKTDSQDENILRAPLHFTPVFGDFGPETCSDPPTEEDYQAALWVTAKQNGILQTWAPRWTMFSRGNIGEKARLLTLPSVARAVEEGRLGMGSAAVDLYVGVGYFAFSYVKAGVSVVLGWDINPWSIEGLRRGAGLNGWESKICGEGEVEVGEERLLIFNESNEFAPQRIAGMKDKLPPIRHVNCGMLPSSRKGLVLAASILDAYEDGWVHVHENFLVEEIKDKAEETRAELQSLVEEHRGREVRVELEFVNRLKSYAPGVEHVVLDILVGKTDPT